MSQQKDTCKKQNINPDIQLGVLLDEKMRACDAASSLYTQEVERKLAMEEGEKRGEEGASPLMRREARISAK